MLSHIELLTKSNLLLLRKQPRAPSTGYGTIPIKHLTKKKTPSFSSQSPIDGICHKGSPLL